MKKVLLLLTLTLGLVLLGSTSSWASILVHDASYHWKTGGTFVDQTTPTNTEWNVGNPTGSDVIQVFEKVFDMGDGTGEFDYTVTNDAFSDIYSFNVANVGLTSADILGSIQPTGWTFSIGSSYLTWSTTTNPLTTVFGSRVGLFSLLVPGHSWDISGAAVDVLGGGIHNEGGLWIASHPVPEPATTSLLGLGLLGFVGKVVRKKFKA